MKIENKNFWKHVVKNEDGCWIWTGTFIKNVGPQFRMEDKPVTLHNYLWNKPIPKGFKVGRKCWNMACVNPKHFQLSPIHYKRPTLSEDQIANIRQRWETYKSNSAKKIAKDFGVSVCLIWNITHKRGPYKEEPRWRLKKYQPIRWVALVVNVGPATW